VSRNSLKKQFIDKFDSIDFNKVKDHPNILIAANFWDNDRYCAARVLYKFMRTIDDMIDDHKAANRSIEVSERKEFTANVNDWLKMIIVSGDCNPEQSELLKTIEKFRIPLWPLEDFARSMIYDINNDGFPTLAAFIEYSNGASVAPASVFVHLSGLTIKNEDYIVPSFNVREAAMPCALFSYLVHIIRDFEKDQLNNLNYFADDLLKKHGLARENLIEFANGTPVSLGFRELIREYYTLADGYRLKTQEIIKQISPLMEPRYQLSLEIIFDLYLMIFERIDIEQGTFTTAELNPTPYEIRKRVYDSVMRFNS
jgi:phytoene/squalene synthetase